MRWAWLGIAACAPAEAPLEAPAEPHVRMLVVDNAPIAQVALVDTRGGGWITPLPDPAPRDVTLVGDEVLVSTGVGALRLALADGAVVGRITGFVGVQSARPAADGGALLAAQDRDDVVLTEVDAAGAAVGEPRRLPGYADLRLVRELPGGHLLFTTTSGGARAVDVGPDGAEAWTAALPGKGYLAERQADGSTLATTGDDVRVVRLDAAGDVIGGWGGRDVDAELHPSAFFSGFHAFDEAHVAVANWHGHDLAQGGPHVVVYGGDGARAWAWEDERVQWCTNVHVLEAVDVEAL